MMCRPWTLAVFLCGLAAVSGQAGAVTYGNCYWSNCIACRQNFDTLKRETYLGCEAPYRHVRFYCCEQIGSITSDQNYTVSPKYACYQACLKSRPFAIAEPDRAICRAKCGIHPSR
jgi:hypothetical protein